MIEVKNISKQYQHKVLYENISFKLEAPYSYALVGKSGSGKTTLLNILSGLDTPSSGEVFIQQKPLNKKTVQSFRKETFGYIFQNYGLVDQETIYDNLMIGLNSKKRKKSKKELRRMMQEQMKQLGLDDLSLDTKVCTLSGGEQQRIALIRLILRQPDIVFADEPTGSLDKDNATLIMEQLFHQLNDQLLIIATHDLDIAKQCDFQIMIDHHQINIIKNEGVQDEKE